MAQKIIEQEVLSRAGTDIKKAQMKNISMSAEVKTAIVKLRSSLTNATLADCVYNIVTGNNVYNSSDSSVPHGPAAVSGWLAQIPREFRKMINGGQSYGFVTGNTITNPFILAGSDIILPSTETNFNRCVEYCASLVANKIVDSELAISPSTLRASTLNARKSSSTSSGVSSLNSFNNASL